MAGQILDVFHGDALAQQIGNAGDAKRMTRGGAVAKLRRRDFYFVGEQWSLRFHEKGGKSREIPARHDLQGYLSEYLDAAGLRDAPKDSPLFRTAVRKEKRLTQTALTTNDVYRMIKRRMSDVGLPPELSSRGVNHRRDDGAVAKAHHVRGADRFQELSGLGHSNLRSFAFHHLVTFSPD